MLDEKTISNLNITGKNILKDNAESLLNNSYAPPESNEFSNLILNSNLSNGNIIK